ncbi:Metal-dependent hydrolases of the beta-lactamase superfamily I [hydrothermal vent metagenome]|uniref:Metal-dependent hydrolases of the beta-lactamase superfamily I n=1 Tax=hydrothermal vent metagenome TaxID=652676 RepID=A0A3B1B9E8_9ZZZZ
MDIRFWGVRGSLPSPGPDTSQFGGNTPCVEVRNEGEPLIVLDAGTGIRKLGMEIINDPTVSEIHIFFSHTHWDHIQGLPFFAPLFSPKYKIKLHGPVHYSKNLEEILSLQMEYTYFPVRVAELASELSFHDISEEKIKIGNGITMETKYVNHPVICLAYKVTKDGKSFVYITDHEPYRNLFADADEMGKEEGRLVVEEQMQALIDFVEMSDLLVIDGQYTPQEYETKIGWGHSSLDDAYALARNAGVKEMVIFHHDPDRTDAELQQMLKDLQDRVWDPSTRTIPVRLAREQLVIKL